LTNNIKGIIPAVLTPFDKHENIDINAFKELLNYLMDKGVHGLFILGSQGEFYALTLDECKKLMDAAVSVKRENIPIYAGIGRITTRETIELAKYALDVGIDYGVVVTPFYVRLTQKELEEHYKKIAESVELKILLYNNPSNTNINLEPDTVYRLRDISNIVGIKESTPYFSQLVELIQKCRSAKFHILVGLECHILGGLLLGADGAVVASANAIPDILVSLYENFTEGNLGEAIKLQQKVNEFFNLFKYGTFPGILKDIMEIMGFQYGKARSPVKSITRKAREEIRFRLKILGLL